MDLICVHFINFKKSNLGDERLTKALFPLKVFEYHSCPNELGKIEGKILYKTFLLM